MIDHIGFPVSDYPRSKSFYEKALAPLGYTLIMEVGADHTDSGSRAPIASGRSLKRSASPC